MAWITRNTVESDEMPKEWRSSELPCKSGSKNNKYLRINDE
jgi:hypothetical protein